jgi:hypothetical protein
MNRLLIVIATLAIATPAFAADLEQECRDFLRLGSLYEVRAMMLKPYTSEYEVEEHIAKRLASYREGWVRWVRPDSDAPVDKHGHTVAAVNGATADSFEASGAHAYAVKIVVPSKRSLFNRNTPVYVGTVRISYDLNGRIRTRNEPVNAWMNPDTSRTIDLEGIADHVDASLESSAKASDVKQSLVEIHFVQAVPRDDPSNPAYETIQSLERIHSSTTPYTIDSEIATAERQMFPAADSLPLVSLLSDLRRAEQWRRSSKEEEKEKGEKLLKETLRRLR